MDNVEMVYSENRDTWNVFVNGEWYFEGNYENANEVYTNCLMSNYEDDDYYGDCGDDYDYEEEYDYDE